MQTVDHRSAEPPLPDLAVGNLTELAQLLTACWRLATSQSRIPSYHGILDRALQEALAKGAFPEWFRKELHFADARMGTECIELADILARAQDLSLTAAPNAVYRTTEVRLSEPVAEYLLERLRVSAEDARRWGDILVRIVDRLESDDRRQRLAALGK